MGGRGFVIKSKKSQVSVGKSSKLGGGVYGNQKSPKFQRVPTTNKIMTHFHLLRTQKHKIWSIVLLNMAKYTIISLILTDFVPIFFIFNLFQKLFGGHPTSKKSHVDFRGGGGHPPFGLIPKFRCFFDWKASLRDWSLSYEFILIYMSSCCPICKYSDVSLSEKKARELFLNSWRLGC